MNKSKKRKAVSVRRDGRFATRKNQTQAERQAADRDQTYRDLSNKLMAAERELDREHVRAERYWMAFESLMNRVAEGDKEEWQKVKVPLVLQVALNDLRRYSHEIGTVGSSERAMAAVNALCKWGNGPQVAHNDSGGAQGILFESRRDMTQPFEAGTCHINATGYPCALKQGHVEPHLGPCGCSNGCKAWNCPNV